MRGDPVCGRHPAPVGACAAARGAAVIGKPALGAALRLQGRVPARTRARHPRARRARALVRECPTRRPRDARSPWPARRRPAGRGPFSREQYPAAAGARAPAPRRGGRHVGRAGGRAQPSRAGGRTPRWAPTSGRSGRPLRTLPAPPAGNGGGGGMRVTVAVQGRPTRTPTPARGWSARRWRVPGAPQMPPVRAAPSAAATATATTPLHPAGGESVLPRHPSCPTGRPSPLRLRPWPPRHDAPPPPRRRQR